MGRRLVGVRGWFLAGPWPLTFSVALIVALPSVMLGEISAQDARTRAHADQLAITKGLAQQAATNVDDAVIRVRDSLAAAVLRPSSGRPTELIDALQRNDLASVQTQLRTLQDASGLGGAGGGFGVPSNRGSGQAVVVGGVPTEELVLADEFGTIVADSGAGTIGRSLRPHPAWGRATKDSPVYVTDAFDPLTVGDAGAARVTVSSVIGILISLANP